MKYLRPLSSHVYRFISEQQKGNHLSRSVKCGGVGRCGQSWELHWKVSEHHVYIIKACSPPSLEWSVASIGLLSVVLHHETGHDLADPGGYHVSVHPANLGNRREQVRDVAGAVLFKADRSVLLPWSLLL